MALQMARPYKHPKTGVYYFRQHVPTDLRRILGDKIVSRPLHTKDPETAKLRNVDEVRKQALIWAGHRKRPEPLPFQQIVALSDVLYRDHMAAMALRLPGNHGGQMPCSALPRQQSNRRPQECSRSASSCSPWFDMFGRK